MGIGDLIKGKKGLCIFLYSFPVCWYDFQWKGTEGVGPFMSAFSIHVLYTYPSSIGIYFFRENKKKRKEREMSSFLSALESRDVGDWAFLPLFLSITFPPFFGLCCLKMLNWFDSFWFRWPEFNGFFFDWPDEPPKNKQRTDGLKK
jgi:hypothetical protein